MAYEYCVGGVGASFLGSFVAGGGFTMGNTEKGGRGGGLYFG